MCGVADDEDVATAAARKRVQVKEWPQGRLLHFVQQSRRTAVETTKLLTKSLCHLVARHWTCGRCRDEVIDIDDPHDVHSTWARVRYDSLLWRCPDVETSMMGTCEIIQALIVTKGFPRDQRTECYLS